MYAKGLIDIIWGDDRWFNGLTHRDGVPIIGSKGRPLLEIKDQQEAVVTTFRDPLLGLLLDSPTAREEWLRSHRSWFDCATDEFEKAVTDIVSTEELQDRVEKAFDMAKSLQLQYSMQT